MKKSILLSVFVFSIVLFAVLPSSKASASFNQNNIMGENTFNASYTLTAAQIDAMLNTFPSSCISTNKGFSAPNVIGYNPSQGFLYGSNVSAGTVIYNASQAYDLNPQVILTTLQKEQSLVSGSAGCYYETPPTQTPCPQALYGNPNTPCVSACQYSGGCVYIAMGYDCPYYCKADSTGFSKQIIKTAWKLKFVQQRSLGNYNWNIQKPGWDNSDDPLTSYDGYMTEGTLMRNASSTPIYYDGLRPVNNNALTVHLDTGATASLYSYTPFTNGNQSFVNIFEGWFGSTQDPSWAWQFISQEVFVDNNKNVPQELSNTVIGGRYYLVVKAKNMGNQTWQQNTVRLGTASPVDRASNLYDNTWITPNRVGTIKETSVAPGSIGTFEFWIKAPASPGTPTEYFNLVAEGQSWMNDIGMFIPIAVKLPYYSWQFIGQATYTDQTKTTLVNLSNPIPGSSYYVKLTAKNTGNLGWLPSFTRIGTSLPRDRNSPAYDASWVFLTRPSAVEESVVFPGHIGTFEFWAKVPTNTGNYKEYYNLVADGYTWMNDLGMHVDINVQPPNYKWQFVSQQAYTNSSKTTSLGSNNLNLAPNAPYYLVVKAKNVGNTTWSNANTRLGTSSPKDRTSSFMHVSWASSNRAATLVESSVPPGSTGTFEFWVQSPTTPGTYKEHFTPLVEGTSWMNDIGLYFNMVVN